MASKDVTRLAVERTSEVIVRLREHMKLRVPTGPSRPILTPKQTRMQLQRMDPLTKTTMIEKMGPDAWNVLMEKLYGQS